MHISKSVGFAVAAFIVGAAGTVWSAPPAGPTGTAKEIAALQADVSALQSQVSALQTLLGGVTRLTDASGYDTLRFSAMNVQVVNGTNNTQVANGLGNVLVAGTVPLSSPATR